MYFRVSAICVPYYVQKIGRLNILRFVFSITIRHIEDILKTYWKHIEKYIYKVHRTAMYFRVSAMCVPYYVQKIGRLDILRFVFSITIRHIEDNKTYWKIYLQST